jgi:hypothetical protein
MYHSKSYQSRIGEMLEKQRQLYLDMDVPVPTNITLLCVDAEM